MYTITKEFEFSASHWLEGLPEGHSCGRLHGHNYKVTVELQTGELNHVGFVRDYGDLRAVKELIDERLDHRHLNEVVPVNPTAENLAIWLFGQLWARYPELVAVRVSETPKTWAEYRENRPIAINNNPSSTSEITERVIAEISQRMMRQRG